MHKLPNCLAPLQIYWKTSSNSSRNQQRKQKRKQLQSKPLKMRPCSVMFAVTQGMGLERNRIKYRRQDLI